MEWNTNGTEKTTGSQLRVIAMMAPLLRVFSLSIWESDDMDTEFSVL